MSHALCIVAGFLSSAFVHSVALDLTPERTAFSFLGAALCLVGACIVHLQSKPDQHTGE